MSDTTVASAARDPSTREAPAALELVELVKRFGAVLAVDRVSLQVQPGEMLALLGPSGCGKTTTLRMVAGFEQPDEGHVRIAGEDMTDWPPHRRDTGMVFQNLALFPHMTVRDNVGFGLRMRGVGRTESDQRIKEALTLVSLAGYEDRYPRQLSGGQQQRVALARALVIRPRLLLLDEPLSSLDAKLRQELRIEIRQIQQRVGITALYVTHDQEEALSVADRLAVMNRGQVEQIGPPTEVYEWPRTAFVAAFIGQSNLFQGEIVGHEDGGAHGVVRIESGQLIRSVNPQRLAPHRQALVSVKFERVRLRPEAEPSLPNSLPAIVRHSTYLGASVRYVCSVDGRQVVALVPNDGRQAIFSPGTGVRVEWRPEDAVLLPPAGATP